MYIYIYSNYMLIMNIHIICIMIIKIGPGGARPLPAPR